MNRTHDLPVDLIQKALEQFFGIAYRTSCGRLTPLARSGLAASVSFHKAEFRILNTRHSCKAGFILSFNIIAIIDYLEYFRIM